MKAVLVELYDNRSTAGMVADEAGAKLPVLPDDDDAEPEIKTYPDLVEALLRRLTGAR